MVATAQAEVKPSSGAALQWQAAYQRARDQGLIACPLGPTLEKWVVTSGNGQGYYHVRLYPHGATACDCEAGANALLCKHVCVCQPGTAHFDGREWPTLARLPEPLMGVGGRPCSFLSPFPSVSPASVETGTSRCRSR
jgi:hypothetical protein